jgi:hypothetical protein
VTSSGPGLVKLPVSLSPAQYEWLRKEAFRRHVAMTVVVREALDELRGRLDPQLPLPLDREDRT